MKTLGRKDLFPKKKKFLLFSFLNGSSKSSIEIVEEYTINMIQCLNVYDLIVLAKSDIAKVEIFHRLSIRRIRRKKVSDLQHTLPNHHILIFNSKNGEKKAGSLGKGRG